MNTRYIGIGVIIIVLGAGGFLFATSRSPVPSNASSVVDVNTVATDAIVSSQKETPAIESVPEVVSETPTIEVATPKTDTPLNDNVESSPEAPLKKPLAKDSVTEKTSTDKKEKNTPQKTSTSTLNITTQLVNFGFAVPSKSRTIDTIILHTSYDASGSDPYSISGIIAQWKGYGVAPHYLVGHDGSVYRLVKDENIAYHAGVSAVPDGRTNVNDFSIGIEIASTQKGDYTDEQYASIKKLIASLKEKYAIEYVLGHDDIAPGRKTDPWNFDWKKLK